MERLPGGTSRTALARTASALALVLALLAAAGGRAQAPAPGAAAPGPALPGDGRSSDVAPWDPPPEAWTRAIGHPFPFALKASEGIDDGPFQGLPIGGLGAGSIGRTYRGDFARWHLDVGQHLYRTLAADQFSVRMRSGGGPAAARVLSVWKPADGSLSAWGWDPTVRFGNTYHALFPRAWWRYRDLPVDLDCLQFSPFLPGNYRESSYPVGVFVWRAANRGPRRPTCRSSSPGRTPPAGGATPRPRRRVRRGPPLRARLGRERGGPERSARGGDARRDRPGGGRSPGPARRPTEEWDGQFAIAAPETEGCRVTRLARFDPSGSGAAAWEPFARDGLLPDAADPRPAARGERLAAALAVSFRLAPGEERTVPVVLAWDFPVMEFGKGAKWYRRYTRFFGRSGRSAWAIAREALARWREWDRAVDAWMRPYLADGRTPPWYRTALFNELYALLDLGTAWEDGAFGTEGGTDYPPLGRFGLLECFDYRFYSTLDVAAYGSFATHLLFPELDKQEVKLFAGAVAAEDLTEHPIGWTKERRPRKLRGIVPMDLGVPGEDPWRRTDFYTWQDPNSLKDEAPDLALRAWRDSAGPGGGTSSSSGGCGRRSARPWRRSGARTATGTASSRARASPTRPTTPGPSGARAPTWAACGWPAWRRARPSRRWWGTWRPRPPAGRTGRARARASRRSSGTGRTTGSTWARRTGRPSWRTPSSGSSWRRPRAFPTWSRRATATRTCAPSSPGTSWAGAAGAPAR